MSFRCEKFVAFNLKNGIPSHLSKFLSEIKQNLVVSHTPAETMQNSRLHRDRHSRSSPKQGSIPTNEDDDAAQNGGTV